MMTVTKSFYATLATMRSLLWKPSSEPEALDVRIAKVNLSPGDTLVVHVDRFLTPEQRLHIKAMVADIFVKNKVVVLEGGLKLSVISQDATRGDGH